MGPTSGSGGMSGDGPGTGGPPGGSGSSTSAGSRPGSDSSTGPADSGGQTVPPADDPVRQLRGAAADPRSRRRDRGPEHGGRPRPPSRCCPTARRRGADRHPARARGDLGAPFTSRSWASALPKGTYAMVAVTATEPPFMNQLGQASLDCGNRNPSSVGMVFAPGDTDWRGNAGGRDRPLGRAGLRPRERGGRGCHEQRGRAGIDPSSTSASTFWASARSAPISDVRSGPRTRTSTSRRSSRYREPLSAGVTRRHPASQAATFFPLRSPSTMQRARIRRSADTTHRCGRRGTPP